MGALTTTQANAVLDHNNLVTSYTPTGPLMLRLMTANGTATAAGTEVTGGSYAAEAITFDAALSGQAASSALISFADMPAVTVVGVEIWDSAATPVRLWWGETTSPVTVSAGTALEFAVGAVVVSFP